MTTATMFGAIAVAALALAANGAQAQEVSILGQWQIVEAVPAPWSPPDQRKALAAEGKRLLKLVINFTPNAVKSRFKLFNCTRGVAYDTVELPVDTLFQGNLSEPNPTAEAMRMGFPRGDIPSVDVQCINAKFTFHFRDPDTAMFNLNRVIYTLKRR